MTRHTRCTALAAVLIGGCALACGGGATQAAGVSVPAAGTTLSGTVTIDGSSTVLPVARRVAEAFQNEHPRVRVPVNNSGTGGGFKKFCAGQADLADASRPINKAEVEECQRNHVDFVELPLAFDTLSVVVNPKNTFVECLTVAELKKMWEPAAQNAVTRWRQIRSSFPDQPIDLFGPGPESGTFDYFTLAIVGIERSSRTDYAKSEDDTTIVNGVAGSADALGYFGYSYYAANRDALKLVSIDAGKGCVAPSVETAADNTYQPLTRPIFVYANKGTAVSRPEVAAVAHAFVAPENARFARDVGYVPLPPALLLSAGRRLDRGVTGSIFNGKGSVLGVTADVFAEEEQVKNALVR